MIISQVASEASILLYQIIYTGKITRPFHPAAKATGFPAHRTTVLNKKPYRANSLIG